MEKNLFPRPLPGDCDPYYFTYIDQVEADVPVLEWLIRQKDIVSKWIRSLTPSQLQYSYAPGKWTVGQMIGHILDTERVFAHRMFSISRNDPNALPGFEQDGYVENSIYDRIPAESLTNEWDALRQSSILLATHMSEEMTKKAGIANGHVAHVSLFPYLLVGHVNHHLKTARELYNLDSPYK